MARVHEFTRRLPELKSLPSNLEAERFVLGSVLTGDVSFPTVARSLTQSDFSLEKHRRIFSSMGDLAQRGAIIDRVTLADELKRHNQLDSVDGVTYLVSLDDGMPRIVNIESYISIVRQKATLRQIIFAADQLQKGAGLEMDDPTTLIAQAHRIFDEIAGRIPSGDGVILEIPSTWKYEDTSMYLIDGLLIEGAVTMWSGESGDGKSTLALALAASVAQGHPFLGRTVKQRPVLYMDRENPIATVKDRLFQLGIPDIHDQLKIWGTWWDGHYPPGPGEPQILSFARERRPLIIWDSLVAFAQCDENSAQEMRRHMSLYRALATAGASSLIIHHRSDKGEADYRGSSDIRAAVDSGWVLSRDDGSTPADQLGRLALKPYKMRTRPAKRIRIDYSDGAFLPMDGPPRPAVDIVIDLVRSHPGTAQKDLVLLAMKQGLTRRTIPEALSQAVLAGTLQSHVSGRNHAIRYYPPETSLDFA